MDTFPRKRRRVNTLLRLLRKALPQETRPCVLDFEERRQRKIALVNAEGANEPPRRGTLERRGKFPRALAEVRAAQPAFEP